MMFYLPIILFDSCELSFCTGHEVHTADGFNFPVKHDPSTFSDSN